MFNPESFIERLLPNLAHARTTAEQLRDKFPGATQIDLAKHLVHSAKLKAAAAGAATGAASSPLAMLPAALADVAAVLSIEAQMIAEIAALFDPSALDNPNTIRADIIAVIFPAAASQALRQFGIRAGERLSQAALRKYAGEDFVRSAARLATRYLGKKFTADAVVSKAVPIVGMGIGAGWNWLEVKAIGARCIAYYSDEPIAPAPSNFSISGAKKAIGKVSGFISDYRSRKHGEADSTDNAAEI